MFIGFIGFRIQGFGCGGFWFRARGLGFWIQGFNPEVKWEVHDQVCLPIGSRLSHQPAAQITQRPRLRLSSDAACLA